MRAVIAARLANLVAILIALAAIWQPEIAAHWVSPHPVDDASLATATREPESRVLSRISHGPLGWPAKAANERASETAETVQAADAILAGQARFFQQPTVANAFPFRASNLDRGPPTHQLYIAGLGTVEVLVGAYKATSDERYFKAATEELLAFNRVDRSAFVPRGLLWNDHALANATGIVIDYWRLARARPDLDSGVARQVLELAARNAERLAKHGLFTYRTNHGVMQNLALLQFAAAFPWYPKVAAFRKLACERLKAQFEYYVSPEGLVLEHSAGYHEFGRNLLGSAVELAELNGCPEAVEWRRMADRARLVSGQLRRPDGSVPVYGNTDYALDTRSPTESNDGPPLAFAVYPISSLAVWWTGTDRWPEVREMSQTTMTWANFPSHAHKLDDDLAVVVWAGGATWFGNVGYWPYGAPGFDDAHGWRGSNAPHFVGEGGSKREARLRAFGNGGQLQVVDVERRNVDHPATLRRQVVAVGGRVWIVVDSVAAQRLDLVERVWTSQPEATVRQIDPSTMLFVRDDLGAAARLSFLGDVAEAPETYRGSTTPFAGWIVRNGIAVASPSVVVRQKPGTSMLVTVIELGTEAELQTSARPLMVAGAKPDEWEIRLAAPDGAVVVNKAATTLRSQANGVHSSVSLSTPTVEKEQARIVDAYRSAVQQFPRVKEYVAYRFRVSWLALVLVAFQEASLAVVRRFWPKTAVLFRGAAAGCWLLFAGWAALWYLR